jgi:hypothetical protein
MGAGVHLTIKVAVRDATALKLVWTEDGILDMTRVRTPNVVLTTTGTTGASCYFSSVQPGPYAVSIDGRTWVSLLVLDAPSEQVLNLEETSPKNT